MERFVDIHCHLLPGLDDGSRSWDETLAMARMASMDGIETIIVTPHQLGNFSHNSGDDIRHRTQRLRGFLRENDVDLQVLPGADVRIDPELPNLVHRGEVVTLGDHRLHVLLELPHEMYFPLEPLLENLDHAGLTGILSHPERNHGLQKKPEVIRPLIERGCLMQVTAGSLLGTFGGRCREFTERLVRQGLAHFVATDAHGSRARRPLMRRAYDRVAELAGVELAEQICCINPGCVAAGQEVVVDLPLLANRRSFVPWRRWRRAG